MPVSSCRLREPPPALPEAGPGAGCPEEAGEGGSAGGEASPHGPGPHRSLQQAGLGHKNRPSRPVRVATGPPGPSAWLLQRHGG